MAANPENLDMTGAEHVEVKPVSVHIGAEISGVDCSAPLSPAEVAAIRQALLKWKVVFFRDQPLDHQQHVDFSTQFGDPTPGHVVFGGNGEFPAIYSIAKFRKANSKRGSQTLRPWSGWHADITAAINPPSISILRGVVVPPYGGDTMWTNLAAAYEGLSPALRAWLETLHGEHRYELPTGSAQSKAYDELVEQRTMVTHHPLVRVHPETGERVLYVSPAFLNNIPDLAPAESKHVTEMLWEHAVLPEYTARFRWEPDSIAMWDNRATAHLAPRDIFATEFDRQFYRVTLMGDVPTGVDGQTSRSIDGDPITPL